MEDGGDDEYVVDDDHDDDNDEDDTDDSDDDGDTIAFFLGADSLGKMVYKMFGFEELIFFMEFDLEFE